MIVSAFGPPPWTARRGGGRSYIHNGHKVTAMLYRVKGTVHGTERGCTVLRDYRRFKALCRANFLARGQKPFTFTQSSWVAMRRAAEVELRQVQAVERRDSMRWLAAEQTIKELNDWR